MKFSVYKKMVQTCYPDLYKELCVKRMSFSVGGTRKPADVFTPVDWLDAVKDQVFLAGTPQTDEIYQCTREHLIYLRDSGDHGFIMD
jgi:hypothetical protein